MPRALAVTEQPALHRFAVFTAVATLGLLGIGGLVTSHGAGMAVPDWPNTYGYNMFFFPVSKWVGGILYEHTHRLIASGVGLLTVVLALWLYGRSARPVMRWGGLGLLALGVGIAAAAPQRWADAMVLGLTGAGAFGASWIWPHCEPSAKWLRRCGIGALTAVVLQGVLGGLRVVLLKDAIGIFHATLAQLFFVLVCAIALFTSRWWQALPLRKPLSIDHRLAALFVLGTVLILAQLILGATMRHQHAGLAIPDFPLAYGRLWPATDAAAVAHYNARRMEVVAANPITSSQIILQMAHRLLALVILGAVAFATWSARRRLSRGDLVRRLALAWLGLILIQAFLGAATIWSNKAADVATAHVLVGALSLAMGAIMSLIAWRDLGLSRQRAPLPAPVGPLSLPLLNHQPSATGGLH